MKTKINKILGVVLTAMTVVSLFVVAAPASAAAPTPQAWNTYTIPGTAGMVLNTTITAGGPIAQASDASALYAYVLDGGVNKIIKSIDNGRTWKVSGTVGQPLTTVAEIVCSPSEPNVVFYATAGAGSTLYMSQDAGATFIPMVSVPGTDAITALDVAKWSGRYIAVVGVDSTLGGATMLAGVYSWDQADVFNNLVPVGTTTFNGATPKKVLSVRMAPTFGTDRAVIAMGVAGGVATVRVDINGGAWGAIVADFTTGTAVTAADIQTLSDFNATTNPIYFICTSATNGGIFRVVGSVISGNLDAATSNITRNWTNMSVNGSFASGTASILVGGATGKVYKSTNSGNTFSNVTLRSVFAAPAWVLLDRNYPTSKMAWVLNVGGMGGALNVSTDSLSNINQWSLVNETISAVDNYVVGPNGDLYLITRNTDGVGASAVVVAGAVTIVAGTVSTATTPAVLASQVTVTASGACTVTITPVSGSPVYGALAGGTRVGNIITFTGAGTQVITGSVANTQFNVTASVAATVTVPVANGGVVSISADPNFTIQLPNLAAAEIDTLTTDTVITGVPTTGVTVTGTLAPGDWNQAGGTITFSAAGQTAIITNSAATPLGATVLTATYTLGAGVVTPGVAPSATANATATIDVSGTWGASGTTRSITEGAGAAAIPSTNTSKIWRQLNSVGTPWERVLVGAGTDAQRILIAVDSAYSTDKAVFYTVKGANTAILISTNNANSFSAMSSAPGVNVIPGGPFAVNTFLPLNATTVVVGDTTGSLVTNSTSYWWLGSQNVPFTAGYTVDNIVSAGGTTLFAIAHNATTVQVAKSADNGATWTLLLVPGSTTNVATITGAAVTNSFIQPAADFATSGNIFIAVADTATNGNGVYRFSTNATAVPTGANAQGWRQVDLVANGSAVRVVTASGLEVGPGGPGSTTEGLGMVYASDSSVNGTVARVRGTAIVSELLDSTASSLPATGLSNLQAYPSASGNVQTFALGADNKLYFYIDTLGIPGTGVDVVTGTLVTNLGGFFGIIPPSSACTLTWNNLPNATVYYVFVNPVRQTNLYTAASALATVAAPVIGTTTSTAAVTAMLPGTTYFVSIWATNGVSAAPKSVSSFMFGGNTSFQTPLAVPTTPMELVPALGANNVSIVGTPFAWMTVPGATSYTLQVTLATDPNFASPVLNNATVPAVTGPTGTFSSTVTLLNNTSYIWRVKANGTGASDWVYGNFTTIPAVVPPVTVTNAAPPPVPTIIITAPAQVTITAAAPVPTPTLTVNVTQPTYTIAQPEVTTPTYIWIIVGVGALLTLAVIILIIRTRRVV